MRQILAELKKVHYLRHVVLVLDRATREQHQYVASLLTGFPCRVSEKLSSLPSMLYS